MSGFFCNSPRLQLLERQMCQPPGYRPRGHGWMLSLIHIGISVKTLCESYCSQRIELHRIKAQYPVAQLERRCAGEQL